MISIVILNVSLSLLLYIEHSYMVVSIVPILSIRQVQPFNLYDTVISNITIYSTPSLSKTALFELGTLGINSTSVSRFGLSSKSVAASLFYLGIYYRDRLL